MAIFCHQSLQVFCHGHFSVICHGHLSLLAFSCHLPRLAVMAIFLSPFTVIFLSSYLAIFRHDHFSVFCLTDPGGIPSKLLKVGSTMLENILHELAVTAWTTGHFPKV